MNNEEKILALLEKHGEMLETMNTRMESMDGRLGRLEGDVSNLKSDVSDLKADVSSLKTDVSGLKEDVTGLKDDMAEVRLILENKIEPYIERLAEGHQTLLQTLAPVTRVQALEDEFRNRDMAASIADRVRAQKNAQ